MIFLYGAIVCPFVDFFARFGWLAVVLLAFIGLFRLSDIAMGVMANPFYIDMGFSLQQIANVTKIYGFVMSILGALLGGALVFRLGAPRLLAPSVFLMATPTSPSRGWPMSASPTSRSSRSRSASTTW